MTCKWNSCSQCQNQQSAAATVEQQLCDYIYITRKTLKHMLPVCLFGWLKVFCLTRVCTQSLFFLIMLAVDYANYG